MHGKVVSINPNYEDLDITGHIMTGYASPGLFFV